MTANAIDLTTLRKFDNLTVWSKTVKRNVPAQFASLNTTTGRHFCVYVRLAHDIPAQYEWYAADQIVEVRK